MYSAHFSRSSNRSRGNFVYRSSRDRRAKPVLDIARFIEQSQRQISQSIQGDTISAVDFSAFKILPQLLTNITARGYSKATPIQTQAIPLILENRDVLGIANTGTGKTGAFLIPVLNRLLQQPSQQILIMAPTRELAIQIDEEFRALSRGLRLYSVLSIGGTSMYRQRDDVRRGYHLLIGTPGRVKDILEQRLISFNKTTCVILDEVDRMLDMGFVQDMRHILGQVPKERQSLFFSATASPQVMNLIKTFSRNLMTVSVKTQETAVGIDQSVIALDVQKDKVDILHELLIRKDVEKVLIFGRTKHGVQRLSRQLHQRGFKVDAIHGNKTQPQRQRALTLFRQNQIKVLVATDVAARGLDIENVSHVINYDMPATYEDYVHRIGRTGRGDKRGVAWTLVA